MFFSLWHPTYLLLEVMVLGQFHREKSHCPWKIQRRNPVSLDPSQGCFPSRNVNCQRGNQHAVKVSIKDGTLEPWIPQSNRQRPTHGAWTDASLAWIPPSSRSRRIRFFWHVILRALVVPIGFAVMTTKTLRPPETSV